MPTTTTVSVGKARLFSVAVSAGGVPDTTTAATVGASNGAILRVTMNPSNNRQFAVVGLAVGSTNANLTCGGITAHAFVAVVAAAAPTPDSVVIDEAGVGPEIDPPPWA